MIVKKIMALNDITTQNPEPALKNLKFAKKMPIQGLQKSLK